VSHDGAVPDVAPDEAVQRLADESIAAGDPTGWFDRLYAEAERGDAVVPWDRGVPHPVLVGWAEDRQVHGRGRPALVVGCGPGTDAEYVAGLGFDTVAFDVSATAISAARQRFPGSPVRYTVADLLDPPAEWSGAFALVVESLTVQSMPVPVHQQAIVHVGRFVAPGGTLLVHAAADDGRPPQAPPWPLTRAEVESFAAEGLVPVRIEQVEYQGVYRWRAEFRR
jgi:SAM-dependent methyltransferase